MLLKSDLTIPDPIPKFLSMYLLISMGFNGGVELSHSGFGAEIIRSMFGAVLLAVLMPVILFFILRMKFNIYDSGAIAATYGSVSAVTFITACAFLDKMQVPFGGHMVASMALMESPAIVLGVLLVKWFNRKNGSGHFSWGELFREAFLNSSVILILGSLFIGLICGKEASESLKPFTSTIFKGMLVFFLLDMGVVAAQKLDELKKAGVFAFLFAILVPLTGFSAAVGLAKFLGLSMGDAFLISILAASASYIAVPAAMRLSIPKANISLYVPMALAITFPFNIVIGMPIYFQIIKGLWSV